MINKINSMTTRLTDQLAKRKKKKKEIHKVVMSKLM